MAEWRDSQRGTLVTSDDSDPTGPEFVTSGLMQERERKKKKTYLI